ncbi:hypothetical protein CyaNS01_02621 [Cyanobium sp. NS01]|nr:hypothetical protein CyaNS01_02621 [Cyanobium sp. NS01]
MLGLNLLSGAESFIHDLNPEDEASIAGGNRRRSRLRSRRSRLRSRRRSRRRNLRSRLRSRRSRLRSRRRR